MRPRLILELLQAFPVMSITDEGTPTPTCQRELVRLAFVHAHLTSDIEGTPSSCSL